MDPASGDETTPKHLYDAQAKVWQDHKNNTSNPHNVTKVQVGLSNIPNAKSDAVNLNSSETLATSKAVKTENDLLNAHIANKNNPHEVVDTVSYIGSRSSNGYWTLTGLTVSRRNNFV